MARPINMAAGSGIGFIRPLTPDDPAVGGKGRSLARLARLGLRVPPAFALDAALFQVLRAAGPPPPARLESGTDLAALDLAREAIARAPFPKAFEQQLEGALDAISTAGGPHAAFSVRSSAATEDRPGALGAGIFRSLLRVPRSHVTDAIRQVLASYLTPAAWVYAARRSSAAATDGVLPTPEGAVLIHLFEEGDSAGTVACDLVDDQATPPGNQQTPAGRGPHGPERGTGRIRIDVSLGAPTVAAQAGLRAAAKAAVAAYGPSELEWVGRGDALVFLQLRAYQPAPSSAVPPPARIPAPASAAPPTSATATATATATAFAALTSSATAGGPWIWDAAHNPLPLSPAQTGLVELVDVACRTDIEQRVAGGYLFFRKRAGGEQRPAHLPDGPRRAFDSLTRTMQPRIDALGPAPSLDAALAVYVDAYGPLFGAVARSCAAAKKELNDFLARAFPANHQAFGRLLGGVPSTASRRGDAARAIATAADSRARQEAIDSYLAAYGDESPRWDVAEPTLRERPERLLALASGAHARGSDPVSDPAVAAAEAGKPGAARADVSDAEAARVELARMLDPSERTRMDALVAGARAAVAVGEDDDAFFARLQAGVRRALWVLGEHLVSAGLLDTVDDVFYLPLPLARSLAPARSSSSAPVPRAPESSEAPDASHRQGTVAATKKRVALEANSNPSALPRAGHPPNLRAAAAAGRQAFEAARSSPPAPPLPPHPLTVRGQAGSGGRVIGRAVHHPAGLPTGDGLVLVAATLLPTELPLVSAGALVIETGSVLGHVAAQARERGIPAVVGAAGAVAAIPEGTLVIVDGDRGEVIVMENAKENEAEDT